jgi:hypothetical protein
MNQVSWHQIGLIINESLQFSAHELMLAPNLGEISHIFDVIRGLLLVLFQPCVDTRSDRSWSGHVFGFRFTAFLLDGAFSPQGFDNSSDFIAVFLSCGRSDLACNFRSLISLS